MHSANRAKQRHHQKVVENDFTKKQQVDHHPSSNKPFNNHNNNNNHHVKKDVQIAFGSRIWDERSHPVTNGTPSRRSKSLDRKSNLRKHQIREQSTDERASDSGLSGLDDGSKKAASPEQEAISTVDSGRRSQSFEFLSDDLRSMTLSTPSSPSPRPPNSKIRGHVHFLSKLESKGQNTSAIVRNMVTTSALAPGAEPGPLRKSTSIPVHLTVGTNNEATLPPGLRPHSTCHLEHEPDCAAIKQGMQNMAIANVSSTQSLPNCLAAQTTKGGGSMLLGRRTTGHVTTAAGSSNGGGYATPPTGETVSSLQKKKVLRIHNGYNSLPRSASAREGFYNSNSCNSVASASVVPRSRSSASIGDHHSTPKPSRPSSAASNGPKGGHQRPKSRLGSSQHASLSIAQIQRELKRGEMVQGVLHMGSLRGISFGSRMIKEREEEETCICAPVVIGGKNGHMEWRRM